MRIAVLCDAFPELSETFVVNEVLAMRDAGHDVRVVALDRASRPGPAAPGLDVAYLDELRRPAKLAAGAALALRHPARTVRDLADRGGWRPAEAPRRVAALAPAVRGLERWGVEHLHVHFAAGAAMEGLRIGALLGVPVSVTAHAYDIFLAPRNLPRKLERAAFTTTGCAYNVEHLRDVAGPGAAGRVHEIVMGVDPAVFSRRRPHPASGPVLAVGRLVEKKGFGDLVLAAGLLRGAPGFAGVTIVGEGPSGPRLRERVAAEGLGDVVTFAGPLPPERVRALLEEAVVLAMPCVVAGDGDRDSMPVVVKEAMAMEVPVVATREVGLPEIVDDTCGRLVPPGDPRALAAALRELLALPVRERAALGAAGRERVLERCDVHAETARLLGLMGAV